MCCIPRAGMTASAVRSKLGMKKPSSVTNDHKGATFLPSSSSPDLESRRARRDCRSRPWVTHASALSSHPSLPPPAVSESAATETPCTHSFGSPSPSFDSDDVPSLSSASSSSLVLPSSSTRIPAPRSSRAALRRYVTYAQATVTSTTRTVVRALTPRQRSLVPWRPAGINRTVSCRVGLHTSSDGAANDKLARAKKALTRIGKDGKPAPVLRSALKGGRSVYGPGSGKKLRFRCCPRVYVFDSWKGDLRRETWKDPYGDDADTTPRSEDEPSYHGIAWLAQSQDLE